MLVDYLLTTEPAAVPGGNLGGKATLKRGPEYQLQIATMGKTRADGRRQGCRIIIAE